LRPARRASKSQSAPATRHAHIHVATFVTQVLAQYEMREPDLRDAAKAYADVDNLAYQLPKTTVASL
jgi:hypothetical protein